MYAIGDTVVVNDQMQRGYQYQIVAPDGDAVSADDLQLRRTPEARGDHGLNLAENEARLVRQALDEADGNISHAADALGITRAALYRRIEKFRL